MYSGQFFRVRYVVRHVVEEQNSGTPCFFMLITTIVLNDRISNSTMEEVSTTNP